MSRKAGFVIWISRKDRNHSAKQLDREPTRARGQHHGTNNRPASFLEDASLGALSQCFVRPPGEDRRRPSFFPLAEREKQEFLSPRNTEALAIADSCFFLTTGAAAVA